jgi:hypothetical protein
MPPWRESSKLPQQGAQRARDGVGGAAIAERSCPKTKPAQVVREVAGYRAATMAISSMTVLIRDKQKGPRGNEP